MQCDGNLPFSFLKISFNVYITWIWIFVCIILKKGLTFSYKMISTRSETSGVVLLWRCCTHVPELKPTCESLDAWTLEETRWTVLIIPVGLCCQVPTVVDVIILLLDLQAVKVCGWDGAHGVRAGWKHIQPTDTEQRIQSVYSLTSHNLPDRILFWNNFFFFIFYYGAEAYNTLCQSNDR